MNSFSLEKNNILNSRFERSDSNKIQQGFFHKVFDIKLENKKELL
jgi:hypothetical protein